MKVIRLFLLLSGLLLLVLSLGFFFHTLSFVRDAKTAPGTVVAVETEKSKQGGSDLYRPTVEFSDEAGNTQRFTSSVASSPQGYFVGDAVEVLYRENQPSRARINSFWELWLVPAVCLACGFVYVIVCCVVSFFLREPKKGPGPPQPDQEKNIPVAHPA